MKNLIINTVSESQRTQTPDQSDIFSNISYICGSNVIITDALQQGFDVAQLPNGDLIISEIRTVQIHYSWNAEKGKMVKTNSVY